MSSIAANKPSPKETKLMAQTELKITRRLMEGCGSGDVKALQTVLFDELDRADAPSRIEKARDASGKTLLHFAAATGQLPVINFLTEVAASDSKLLSILNALDNDGATPISSACGACSQKLVNATVKRLLELGANPTLVNHNGVGPLHRAAGEGHVDVLELLLDPQHAVDVNQIAKDTGTALHWAASERKSKAFVFLLEKGAEMNVKNGSGQAPILVAAAEGSGTIVAMLAKAGAATDVELPGGVTLLHVCAEMASEEESMTAISSLLSSSSPPPLHVSLAMGSKYVATKVHPRGLLPVELAARAGHASVVRLMVDVANVHSIKDAVPESLESVVGDSVQKLILFEQESKRQEEKKVLDARKAGQVLDDGTPMSVLLPRVTKGTDSDKDKQKAVDCKDKGNGFFRTAKLVEAIAAYSEGIALDGGNQILWGNRCACHLKLKKWDAAVFDASAALHIEPTWLKARTRLGQAFMGLERFEDAAVTLWEVVKESDDGEAKDRVTSLFQKAIRRAKQQEAEKAEKAEKAKK